MSAWLVEATDPVLATPALAVADDDFGPDLYLLLHSMLDLMYQHRGIGLAAPQIGVSKRVIVWDTGNGPSIGVNPTLLEFSDHPNVHIEGCLSLPGVARAIERPAEVHVEYQSATGSVSRRMAGGLLARVLQHEVDHLDGILMTAHEAVPQRMAVEHPQPL